MKKLSLLILVSTLVLNSKINAQKFFEGELHYKIEYELINQNIPIEILKKEMGNSFKAYIKEDKYIMIHNTYGDLGWTKSITRLDEGYSYIEYQKSDTIYKYRLDVEENKLLEIKRISNKKKKVLKEMCEYVILDYESTDPNSFYKTKRGKYYFSPKYKLNPKKYKGHNEGFWNLYVKESGAISIRNESTYEGLFKSVSEVTKVINKEISNDLFKLDDSKIVKLVD
ncbi:hypothetical protein GTQ40_16220 [Flavobacteriaceae bacterium R38]|nr:hypothetical protein [Flavobacteriaceae bacterium R38]